MDPVTRQSFLHELCPHLRSLLQSVMDCDGGCEVVDFFRHRPHTWIEARDIAGHLHQPPEQVVQSLDRLVEMGIVEQVHILNEAFYALTHDVRLMDALEQFWLVRDDWNVRWEQARETLRLRTQPGYV